MHQAPMDAFEAATKADQFHQSLSTAWGSFLSAQHYSRELNALRKALDDYVQRSNLSITALQREGENRHDLLVAAVAESKSKIEQYDTQLREVATLPTRLSTLQQELSQDSAKTLRTITELSKKVAVQQEGLEEVRLLTAQDIKTIQEQCRLALEKVESLQGELRETKAEKTVAEQKLAALESRVVAMAEARHDIPVDMVKFLDELLSRRDELLELLGAQRLEVSSAGLALQGEMGVPLSQVPAGPDRGITQEQPLAPDPDYYCSSKDNRPPAPSKRLPEEFIQSKPKRPSKDPSQDIRSLYLLFRDRYKTDPPKSDTAFIWEFISSIESNTMSKHIQESLAIMLPECVTVSRDTRRKNPQRHVNISKGLTWRKFREALVRIPGPS